MRSTSPPPTAEDIASLPYFAILALGARCAGQVAAVFGEWEGATPDQTRALTRAVRAVEQLAASPSMVSRTPHWVSARQSTRLAADAASAADMAEAPHVALCAADASAELAGAIDPDTRCGPAARAVHRTVEAAISALEDSDGSQGDRFVEWLTQLIEQLKVRATTEGWTDQTAVTIRDR